MIKKCLRSKKFSEQEMTTNMDIAVVVVGMEHSKFAGNCPGAEKDASSMADLFRQYTSNIKVFLNGTATISNIKNALKDAVKSDLTIFYYSGHGGSERFADTGSEEVDGKDEFLCPYDGYLRDNDLWEITSKAKGRVFEIFDCCHSETMFRTSGIQMRNIPFARSIDSSNPNILVWSGCPDNTYSYGSAEGGQFTNTFLKYYSKSISYADLWKRIKSDSNLAKYESVQKTIIGEFPETKQIFS